MKVWHSGHRCGLSIPAGFGRLAELRKWQRCPRCRHFCEKVDGCHIVKCRCRISFYYKCGRKVYAHFCSCPFSESCWQWCMMISLFLVLPSFVFFLFWVAFA